MHQKAHKKRDLGGLNVLIATEFYYFGKDAIRVPKRFSGLIARSRGHRNSHDSAAIEKFWSWLRSASRRRGRIGLPHHFNDGGCQMQRCEREDLASTLIEQE
jgi:hypothetical protein